MPIGPRDDEKGRGGPIRKLGPFSYRTRLARLDVYRHPHSKLILEIAASEAKRSSWPRHRAQTLRRLLTLQTCGKRDADVRYRISTGTSQSAQCAIAEASKAHWLSAPLQFWSILRVRPACREGFALADFRRALHPIVCLMVLSNLEAAVDLYPREGSARCAPWPALSLSLADHFARQWARRPRAAARRERLLVPARQILSI